MNNVQYSYNETATDIEPQRVIKSAGKGTMMAYGGEEV
jgi:hypothetical protein